MMLAKNHAEKVKHETNTALRAAVGTVRLVVRAKRQAEESLAAAFNARDATEAMMEECGFQRKCTIEEEVKQTFEEIQDLCFPRPAKARKTNEIDSAGQKRKSEYGQPDEFEVKVVYAMQLLSAWTTRT